MLEPVAAGRQGGAFRVPGLFQDARGIVVGHEAAVLVHSHDQLLSLLRIVSEDAVLTEPLASLRAEELRSAIGGQAYLVRSPLSDSRGLDRVARAAAFCGGQLSVGSGRHFVRYRDAQGPYGYDALSIHSGSEGDYVFYAPHATQLYQRVSLLALPRLIGGLPLLPRRGGLSAALKQHDPREPLWLLLPSPLLPRLLRYLWLRGVEAGVCLPEPQPGSDGGHTLVRLAGELARAPAALLGLPGLRWLAPLSESIAVELGHSHPLNLLAFAALFPDSHRHLFLAAAESPLLQPGGPFVSGRHLVSLPELGPPSSPAALHPADAAPQASSAARAGAQRPADLSQLARVRLCLQREATPSVYPAAACVPWAQLATLARLTYHLPPAALASLQAVALESGLLIVGDVSHLPLGELFYEAAPQVLVPLGQALLPRLPATALRPLLPSAEGWLLLRPGSGGIAAGQVGGERQPVEVHEPAANAFAALSQILLARLPAEPAADLPSEPPPPPPSPDPLAVYPPLGWLWPLWGGPRPGLPSAPALPARAAPDLGGEPDPDPSP